MPRSPGRPQRHRVRTARAPLRLAIRRPRRRSSPSGVPPAPTRGSQTWPQPLRSPASISIQSDSSRLQIFYNPGHAMRAERPQERTRYAPGALGLVFSNGGPHSLLWRPRIPPLAQQRAPGRCILKLEPRRGMRSRAGASSARGKSGLHRARCRVTPGRREATESVTENRPPMAGGFGCTHRQG